MLAANVWYWWLGVLFVALGVLAVVGLVGGYLKSVTAAKYPRHDQEDD